MCGGKLCKIMPIGECRGQLAMDIHGCACNTMSWKRRQKINASVHFVNNCRSLPFVQWPHQCTAMEPRGRGSSLAVSPQPSLAAQLSDQAIIIYCNYFSAPSSLFLISHNYFFITPAYFLAHQFIDSFYFCKLIYSVSMLLLYLRIVI